MKRVLLFILCILLVSSFAGCATISTTKAKNLFRVSNGIRVFPLRVYLLVGESEEATIEYWPDFAQAYDIKPIAFLSKNTFTITIDENKGHVKVITADLDSTDALTAMANIVSTLAQAGLLKKSSSADQPKPNTFKAYGLEKGIYRLDDDGVHWIKVELEQTPR